MSGFRARAGVGLVLVLLVALPGLGAARAAEEPSATGSIDLETCPYRVAPGGYPPGAPRDPDVPIGGIRLLETGICYVILAAWTLRGLGSG